MNRHGGKRKGAGRKPAPDRAKKIPISIKVKPDLVEYLRSTANATATIEAAVERSMGYRVFRDAGELSRVYEG